MALAPMRRLVERRRWVTRGGIVSCQSSGQGNMTEVTWGWRGADRGPCLRHREGAALRQGGHHVEGAHHGLPLLRGVAPLVELKSTVYWRSIIFQLQALQASAVNRGSSWGQDGVNLGSTWGQAGIKLGSSWGQAGVNLGSTWGQPGLNLG